MQNAGEEIFEPVLSPEPPRPAFACATSHAATAVARYLRSCADYIREAFTPAAPHAHAGREAGADDIIAVLLEREFNYKSKSWAACLLPGVRGTIAAQMAKHLPLQIFFDYGGGYHATTRPDFSAPLGFDATATELLLLYQIARLERRITSLYPPGLVFHIVLDNGVAHYVNDIPLAQTEGYARQFEALLTQLGAADCVRILLQSRLDDFCARLHGTKLRPVEQIEPAAHHNIERFLGRRCTDEEARLRTARYSAAEMVWEGDLRQHIAAVNGIRFLQRESAEYLPFRPFPGGAIRAQSGQIGFKIAGEKITPTLVTTTLFQKTRVSEIPLHWPSIVGLAQQAAPRPAMALG